ncbi:MAG: hypoxanthine phosphoribosyltransferase [Chloroflexota bacterium]|nr:hypoxanthine phosphoribosyltransferase [Chloroflexota bacterium]MDE2941749.1 hypoxanthine phosphoribosyltransferase [Chloroflexota bacterium]MDE3268474.1 hypoxanthine phosphoribosyltransferase [Chloroflexota bacterium]
MSVGERLELHVSRRRIASAVKRLARQIEADYPEELPVMVGILTGSFVFMADLVRELGREVELEFMRVSSYGSGTSSSGVVKLRMGVSDRVRGRHALIVEDIVDTGRTTAYAAKYLRRRGADSVRICTLLDKPSRRVVPVATDYVGFSVPDRFLVGYGLDHDGRFRSLPDIYEISGGPDGP